MKKVGKEASLASGDNKMEADLFWKYHEKEWRLS